MKNIVWNISYTFFFCQGILIIISTNHNSCVSPHELEALPALWDFRQNIDSGDSRHSPLQSVTVMSHFEKDLLPIEKQQQQPAQSKIATCEKKRRFSGRKAGCHTSKKEFLF